MPYRGGNGGAVDFGNIGGTLSDQTDLQAALDAKLDITQNLADLDDVPTAVDNLGLSDAVIAVTAPLTAGAAGVAGTIAFDTGFVYVCVATNTWKRAALTTW